MTHQHWRVSSSADKSSRSQVRRSRRRRTITMTYSSGQAWEMDRKYEYDQQPAGNLAPSCILCWGFSAALWQRGTKLRLDGYVWHSLCQGSFCVGYGIETDIRIQSSCTICSKISGLSFDTGCPSRMGASSSPCHKRCLRLWSNKLWWMRAIKHQLCRVCQGPPHYHHRVVKSFEPPGSVNTGAGALIRVKEAKHTVVVQTRMIHSCFLINDLNSNSLLQDSLSPVGFFCWRRSGLTTNNFLRILLGHYTFSEPELVMFNETFTF